jgi:hypothetical protein
MPIADITTMVVESSFSDEEDESLVDQSDQAEEPWVYLLLPLSGQHTSPERTPFYYFGDDCGGFMYHVAVPNVGTVERPNVALFSEEWTLLLGMNDPSLLEEGFLRLDGRIVGGGSHFDVSFEVAGTFNGVSIVALVPS